MVKPARFHADDLQSRPAHRRPLAQCGSSTIADFRRDNAPAIRKVGYNVQSR